MKFVILFASAALGFLPVQASIFGDWEPPASNDVRSPCPMLNALANHGILPRDGKDITEEDTIAALGTGLNFDTELSRTLYKFAISTNPMPNATIYSLDHLSRHNIVEHDASLSRPDAYFSNQAVFNQTIFDETKSYWTLPVVDLRQAALSRLARVQTSRNENPNFTLNEQNGLTEVALFLSVIGDFTTATAIKSNLEYFFENERLPVELGWNRPLNVFTSSDLDNMVQRVVQATEEVSGGASKLRRGRRIVGTHPGF
ncbi:Chloroperoxidase [Biscogniauxia mediterranea]|nr:Chloroperoxidase [Biscogniauxia mediterranea]